MKRILENKFWDSLKTICIIFSTHILSFGQTPTGQAVIDSMTAVMSPENSSGLIKQINHYEDGKIRTFQLEIYSSGKGDKMLMRYIKPSSVKGQTFLLLNNGDDIWMYFPRTRRVRKMASHAKKMKVQGGDFSFDDFSSEDTWKKDYSTLNIGSDELNGNSCWKLKATAHKDADVDYPTVVLYVRKDNYYPVQIEYMNEKEVPEKTLTLTDIQEIDGYPTAMYIIMKNHLTNTKTIMETFSVSYKWIPPKGFFSERNLKK